MTTPEKYITERIKVEPSQTVDMIEIAKGSTFPIFALKLTKESKEPSTIVKVQISSELFDFLTGIYGTDEIMIYCDLPRAAIGAFSPDMQASCDILNKLGLISNPEQWVKKASPFVEKVLKRRTK